VISSNLTHAIPENLMVSATAERLAAFVKAKEEIEKSIREVNDRRQQFDIGSALNALCQIAHWVGGMPGRKVLIWVTGDIPYNVNMSPDGKPSKSLGASYFEDYQITYRTLAANNVALYPVDARGLLTDWNDLIYLGPGSDVFKSAVRGEVRPPTNHADVRAGRDLRHLETSHVAMNIMADATGGRAFYNRNDIPKLFASAAQDSARYYMLSYYLNRKQTQPGWHKLKIIVAKNGVTTRARTGFFAPTPESDLAKSEDERVALASPFEYTELPISFRWREPARDGGKTQFELTIPPSAGLVDAEHNVVDLDFLAVANGDAEAVSAKSMRNFHKQLSGEDVQQIIANGLTYIGDLQLKTGDYAVRIVVRDNLSGRLGSLTAPLKVQR
jgi:VWFA-related protein